MNHRFSLAAIAFVVCAGSATLWTYSHRNQAQPSHHPKTSAEARKLLSQLPLWFEPLPDGRFASQSMGRTVVFEDQAAVWKMKGGASVQMQFQNANKTPIKHGVDRLAARFDRYKGNDPKNWTTGITAYQKVAYDAIYPGVDLVFYGKGSRMEHDFIVAPGADPKQIRLAFKGASKVELDARGDLNLDAGSDRLAMTKPVAYQTRVSGERSEVAVRFAESADHSIGFEVGQYDASLALVIDPMVQYSTYFGGNGEDEFVAVTVDLKSDSVWVVGSTDSTDLQTNGGGLNGANASGGRDVIIAQFLGANSGQLLISYSTVYGGTGTEEPAAIGVAPNGNVFVVGSTGSVDLPTVNPFSSTFQGLTDAFVLALDPTQTTNGGSALIYSTFLGGTATDAATAMTFDANSLVYVAGYTLSTDFPTSSGAILAGSRGGYDPFVAKIDPTAGSSGLIYSTTYGGSLTDEATGVAVDSKGIIYLTGWTYSTDFPISGDVPVATYIGQGDAFLVAIDPTKSGSAGIVFCTYLGGSGYDQPMAMQFAPNGNLYIAGYTRSTDFPVVGNAPQRKNAGGVDMFLMALDFKQSPNQWIVYSTYLGGTGDDVPFGMSIDPKGRVSLVGYTHPLSAIANPSAKAFPTTANAVQRNSAGLEEAIIVRLDPSLPAEQAITFSTFWGGPLNDVGLGIFADPRGCFIYAAGSTNSPKLLVVPYAFHTDLATGPDAFLINIDTCNDPPLPTSNQ